MTKFDRSAEEIENLTNLLPGFCAGIRGFSDRFLRELLRNAGRGEITQRNDGLWYFTSDAFDAAEHDYLPHDSEREALEWWAAHSVVFGW